jgi:hypothetical protein
MQFWEMSFYSDVQLQIRNLYLSHEDANQNNVEFSIVTDSLSTPLHLFTYFYFIDNNE